MEERTAELNSVYKSLAAQRAPWGNMYEFVTTTLAFTAFTAGAAFATGLGASRFGAIAVRARHLRLDGGLGGGIVCVGGTDCSVGGMNWVGASLLPEVVG